jgi:catechol-2,3-dioxygenase
MADGETLQFFSGILMVSKNPKRLAEFYKEILNVPLEDERHGDTLPHWGCTIGDIHFAIHPIETFPDKQSGIGAIKMAFTVFDIKSLAERLERKDVKLLYPIKEMGFFLSTAILDPDGNFVEFTQLCDDWFRHLEKRKQKGIDVVSVWKARKE